MLTKSIAPMLTLLVAGIAAPTSFAGSDRIAEIQQRGVEANDTSVARWGIDSEKYISWSTHSNRLVPVYTFGTKGGAKGTRLSDYTGANSPYRSVQKLKQLYVRVPAHSHYREADYLDQTNLAALQLASLRAGKKHIFLVVFDGMDWPMSRAASIVRTGEVAYETGRGSGLHFQDYCGGGNREFGFMVTSPMFQGTQVDVNQQRVTKPGGQAGGYDVDRGGATPWDAAPDELYLLGQPATGKNVAHAYTDSAASATSMTVGVKTYNDAINISHNGEKLTTIAHRAQQRGLAVGAVTSVPISHATPAAAYAHNVSRDDYQDLTRDLLGLKSISHPKTPLPGLDVLIGGGFGVQRSSDGGQGENFVSGNRFLTNDNLGAIDVQNGGRYAVAVRTNGVDGGELLEKAAAQAAENGLRLFGLFGHGKFDGHLPYQTANGDYLPVAGLRGAERYTEADVEENATLADMTRAAIRVLSADPEGFWLMVEPGDVDWAMHNNNLDDAIGAVLSGDAAVKVITDWVSEHSNWDESLLIVTGDHGHYLVLEDAAGLIK